MAAPLPPGVIQQIVEVRCLPCHSQKPTVAGYEQADLIDFGGFATLAYFAWLGAIYYWYRSVRIDLFMLAGRYTLLEQDPLDDLLPLAVERDLTA